MEINYRILFIYFFFKSRYVDVNVQYSIVFTNQYLKNGLK